MSYITNVLQNDIKEDEKEFEVGDLLDLSYHGMRCCEKARETNYARQLLNERNYPLKVVHTTDIGYYYLESPTGWKFWWKKTSYFYKIGDKDGKFQEGDLLVPNDYGKKHILEDDIPLMFQKELLKEEAWPARIIEIRNTDGGRYACETATGLLFWKWGLEYYNRLKYNADDLIKLLP